MLVIRTGRMRFLFYRPDMPWGKVDTSLGKYLRIFMSGIITFVKPKTVNKTTKTSRHL